MSDRYEAVIGLEIHAELKTKSKMFCSCANDPFTAEPNANVCPICIGFPGTLPVPNKRAVELTLAVGRALQCKPGKVSKFDRKNYFYPDLPKGYQISQYDLPLMEGGRMTLRQAHLSTGAQGALSLSNGQGHAERGRSMTVEGTTVRIRRVHLEEDTGKNIHKVDESVSLVDYNRAGVPLIELVTEPDITSPKLALAFAKELQQILRYAGASNADMEKGEMRIEANISTRKKGSKEFGTKVEVKNLNSFRALEQAIAYELSRQEEILEEGGKITQETRGWSEQKHRTFIQRIKEEAEDYRYFPEPDIPPLAVADWQLEVSELPEERRARYIKEYGLRDKDADVLVADKALSDLFGRVVVRIKTMPPKSVANWIINEGIRADTNPEDLIALLSKVGAGIITAPKAKEIIKGQKISGTARIVLPESAQIIFDHGELATIIDDVLSKNSAAVSDVKIGKMQAVSFLVGQVMVRTKGQANPKVVADLLREKLR